MYADDTLIFAETEAEPQVALNEMKEYCLTWDLTVDLTKTKIRLYFFTVSLYH